MPIQEGTAPPALTTVVPNPEALPPLGPVMTPPTAVGRMAIPADGEDIGRIAPVAAPDDAAVETVGIYVDWGLL